LEFLPRGIEDSILDKTIGMTYSLSSYHETTLQYHSPPPSPVPDSSGQALRQCSDEESSAERELEELSASDFSSSSSDEESSAERELEELSDSDFSSCSSKDEESSAERELEELSASDFSSSSSKDEEELPSKPVVRPPSPPILASPDGKSPRGSLFRRKTSNQRKKVSIMETFHDSDASLDFKEDLVGFKSPLRDISNKRNVRFADEIDVNQFSRMGASVFDDLYYASDDLAEFRYEAFMEEAGLDIADFD
jgi:hypothetical protein